MMSQAVRGARAQAKPRRAHSSLRRLTGLLAATSAGASLLIAPLDAGAAPLNTSPPAISGALEVGQPLSATTGTWADSSPIVKYEYQWLRCVSSIEGEYECTDIDYETNSTFTLPWELVGLQAEVTVTATDAQGESSFASTGVTDVIAYDGPRYALGESAVGSGSVMGFVTGFVTGRTADANLACPSACGALYSYMPGTTVELVATPATGAAFLGWRGACVSSAPACSLTLGGDEGVTAIFSGQATAAPPLALGSEGQPEEAPASGSAGAPGLGAWEAPASSATGLPAQLLGIRAKRHRIRAVVRCQEARPCRLSLTLFASAPAAQAMIAQRSFTIGPGRSERVSLALSRRGERILARRRRLHVTARLALSVTGRPTIIGQGHLTLAA